MYPIAKKRTVTHVIIHRPTAKEGLLELAEHVADAHACFIHQQMQKLDCPSSQKLQLLDTVISFSRRKNTDSDS